MPALSVLLKMVPLRDWIYGGVALVLAVFLTVEWHRHNVHEQALGANKVIVADTKTAVAAQHQIAAGTATASTTEASNDQKFQDHVAAPVQPAPSLVCRHAVSATGSAVSQAGNGVAPGADQRGPDGGVGPAFDPAGPLLERAKLADAQIAYLQGRIHELETQMKNSP